MLRRIAHLSVYRPALVLVFIAAFTVFFSLPFIATMVESRPLLKTVVEAVGFKRLHSFMQTRTLDFSASSDTLTVKGSDDYLYFEKIKSIFGDDQMTVIAIITKDGIYNRHIFEKIQRLTENIEKIDGIDRVISLTNVENIWSEWDEEIEDFELRVGKLVEEIPQTPEEWALLEKRALENEIYVKNLISVDGKATSINVVLEDRITEEELFGKDIVGQICRVVEAEKEPGTDIYVTGIPQTKVTTVEYMKRDLRKFIPLTLLLTVVVLIISFRSFRGLFVPMGAVVLSIIWTIGFMGLMEIKFSMVNTVLPSLLVAIGVAYSIHVISAYYQREVEAEDVDDDRDVLFASMKHISMPVTVTGFTTMIGFSSLMLSRIPAIRQMGLLAVFGVFGALVIALTFVPAVMSLLGRPRNIALKKDASATGGYLTRYLVALGKFNLKFRFWILLFGFSFFAVASYGIRFIVVDTDFISWFDDESEIVRSRWILHEHLAGSAPFYITVDAHRADGIKEPDVLKKIEDLQRFLENDPELKDGVDKTLSVVDYIKLLNKSIKDGKPSEFRIPDSKEIVAQELLFYESSGGNPRMLDAFVNSDYSMANIVVRTNIVGSNATKHLVAKIDEWARENIQDATVRTTGTLFLLNKSADEVALGQIRGLATATFVIFIIMSVLFLSVKYGFLSMIPNIYPVVILFGTMGWFGLTLNLSTSIIAAIVLGLAVDNTIHILSRYNFDLKRTRNEHLSMLNTMVSTGRPISFTMATLIVGFGVVSFSDFLPIRHFGMLTGYALIVGMVGDLMILPAIMSYVKMITLWDLLDLKLGQDPTRTIKIFEGLKNRQAKLATLLGHMHDFNKGEMILSEGDIGDEMHVVIQGRVEIFSGDYDSRQTIAILGQGDNFGEMALVRHSVRSASAIALEDTELLSFSTMSLRRVQRRYPWIASQIYLNLTRILSDRLQITTVTAMLRK